MVFSSVVFLFAFLPVVLLLYHFVSIPIWLGSTHPRWRHLGNLVLLGVSAAFYYWGEKRLVWLFLCTVLIDFFCALLISDALFSGDVECLKPGGPRTAFQKASLVASVVSNLVLLGFFKYFNFGVDTFNAITQHAGLNALVWKAAPTVALPLGISFFVFHSMSYTIDVYRGYVKVTRNLIDYASYVLMFPQLVAGPIVRYSLVALQFVERCLSVEIFSSGVGRFLAGLAKKVLIANTASILADRMFALPAADLHFGIAWLGMIAYTIQIYFDFSGYSDMAVGLGRMLGFELPINFDYPYSALSIREFWQRWHISLSTWFRDYLYIPLGGSRRPLPRVYANLVTVFFLCGLWHGAKWTFVAWGLYHGAFLVVERAGLGKVLGENSIVSHLYTLLTVLIGWILFRADTFAQALNILRAMAGLNAGASDYPIQWFVNTDITLALIFGIVFSVPVVPAVQLRMNRLVGESTGSLRLFYLSTFGLVRIGCAAGAMLLCAAWLATGTHNPFIYFRF
jgi:alginate O-acetyltransferase complex protein AlgI